jgi:hypothetical protein
VKLFGNRLLALFIVIIGVLTVFDASVTTDPPVAGVVRWSPCSIVLQMYRGVLPSPICGRCGEPWVRALVALPFWVMIQYLLLLLALVALCLRAPSKVIILISFVGLCSSLRAWSPVSVATRLEFHDTFFGSYRGGQVHFGELMFTNVVVMALLLMVSLDVRDQESACTIHKE